MNLKTNRTLIRPWKLEDIESLIQHANNPLVGKFMRDGFPYPYTNEDARQFIRMTLQNNPVNIFAIEIDNQASGSIGYFRKENVYRLTAEIGYWLGEPHWRKGIMTEVIQAFCSHLFSTTDLIRLVAHTFEHNPVSARVLKKSGFTHEATLRKSVIKNGVIQDENIYALLKVPS